MPASDPSALVITFGKYRGATVAELLERDPAYAQWLLGQGWLAERFAELHAAILTRGAAPDDSPEHNRIQARFLDPLFRAAFILLTQDVRQVRQHDWEDRSYSPRRAVQKAQEELDHLDHRINAIGDRDDDWTARLRQGRPEKADKLAQAQAALAALHPLPLQSGVAFEQNGVDVLLNWGFYEQLLQLGSGRDVRIEIKPAMGDDYPSVMRQMQRLRCRYLLIETYTGAAVPLPLLRNMFAANQCRLVTVADVEAEIANARQLLE